MFFFLACKLMVSVIQQNEYNAMRCAILHKKPSIDHDSLIILIPKKTSGFAPGDHSYPNILEIRLIYFTYGLRVLELYFYFQGETFEFGHRSLMQNINQQKRQRWQHCTKALLPFHLSLLLGLLVNVLTIKKRKPLLLAIP